MRILMAGGGTAGHINPALAIADYATGQDKNTEVLYVGAKGAMEEKLVAKSGYKIKTIEISGFQRKINIENIKKNIKTIGLVFKATSASKKIIRDFNPDVCIGTGGYVSGPVIRAAQKMGIPTLIHEQNAYPGITTKMLAKRATVIMLAIEDAKKHIKTNSKIEITGNPVRDAIIKADKIKSRENLKLNNRPVILSFGGSLGARAINEAMVKLMQYSCRYDKYQHIHAYGQYGQWLPSRLIKEGIDIKKYTNIHIMEYIDNMDECLAAADLVICRAGAMTISELQAAGKPSILIPSPNVSENHQYHNAMALVHRNAAQIIEEKNLTGENLIKAVDDILSDPKKLKYYEDNVKSMSILNANERIYKIIKKLVSKS